MLNTLLLLGMLCSGGLAVASGDVLTVRVLPTRGRDRYVSDGPALHRSHSGRLFMLWSSFTDTGYTTGIAVSDSGTIVGPWRHHSEPLFGEDGGHAMIFGDLDGRLLVALHSPSRSPDERCSHVVSG